MGIIRMRQGIAITALTSLIVGILVLSPVACNSSQNGIISSPYQSPDNGNPKLDSPLNQLALAETQGEAASFAEQSNIELVDGRVRVVIESAPGQIEAASQAAINAGSEVETTYENLIQVSIPVNSLTDLAESDSIRLIRLPQQPELLSDTQK